MGWRERERVHLSPCPKAELRISDTCLALPVQFEGPSKKEHGAPAPTMQMVSAPQQLSLKQDSNPQNVPDDQSFGV